MPDFVALRWVKQELDSDVARLIRKDVRTHRREKGRGGHRFAFTFLKTVWAADDGRHVVLNHIDDTVWQMWYRHPVEGWVLISWHDTRRQAQAAAELDHPQLVTPKVKIVPGINVLAHFPDRTAPTMRVPCSSETTATAVTEAFDKLGCITSRELVEAPVA